MPTILPTDQDNHPIPALRLRAGGAQKISVSASSARNATAFDADTRVMSLYSDVPIYVALGDSSITASNADHYFPAGVYYDIAIGGDKTGHATHIAALAVDGDGTLYLSEKE